MAHTLKSGLIPACIPVVWPANVSVLDIISSICTPDIYCKCCFYKLLPLMEIYLSLKIDPSAVAVEDHILEDGSIHIIPFHMNS